MKVINIPIVIGALSWVTEGLGKWLNVFKIAGRKEAIQITAFLRSARILKRIMETWEEFLLQKLQWKTNSKHACEEISRSK